MKKHLFTHLLIYLSFCIANSQSLSPFIPQDAYVIIKCSPEALFKKMDRSLLAHSIGFQETIAELAGSLEDKSGLPVSAIFTTPTALGINLQQEFYIFLDEQMNPCFLFSLSNAGLFDQWWHDQVTDIAVGNSNGNRMLASETLTIYWNDKVGMVRAKNELGRFQVPGFVPEEEGFDPLPEDIFATLDHAISADPRFESDARGHDLYIWVNYARLYQMQNSMVNALGARFNTAPSDGSYDYPTVPDYDYQPEIEIPEYTYEDGYAEGYDAGFEEALYMYGIDTTAAFLERQVADSLMTLDDPEDEWDTDEEDTGSIPPPEETIIMEEDFGNEYENIPPPTLDYNPSVGMAPRDPITKLLGNAFNPQTFMKRMEMLNNQLRVSAAIDFEKGGIYSHIKTYSNPIYMQMINAANENRPNKQLLKYLPADRLIFASSFSVNTKNVYSYYKDYFIPLLDSSGIITDLVEAYSILLDEEAIFDMLEGDLMFAVTGITEMPQTTYQYVQEGEETVMKEVIVNKPFPELLLMLTYKDDTNWKKLLRLGVRRRLIEQKGNVYVVTKNKYVPEFYIAFNKKILFVTNNKDLVYNKLNTGYTGTKRISGELKKQLQQNNQSAYLDITNLMQAATNINMPGISGDLENVRRQEFHAASFWTENKTDDSVHSKLIFKMGNPKTNVLETILRMLDELHEKEQSKM